MLTPEMEPHVPTLVEEQREEIDRLRAKVAHYEGVMADFDVCIDERHALRTEVATQRKLRIEAVSLIPWEVWKKLPTTTKHRLTGMLGEATSSEEKN